MRSSIHGLGEISLARGADSIFRVGDQHGLHDIFPLEGLSRMNYSKKRSA